MRDKLDGKSGEILAVKFCHMLPQVLSFDIKNNTINSFACGNCISSYNYKMIYMKIDNNHLWLNDEFSQVIV